jgi:membrane protein DedA with SNARE-associated domain
VPSTQDIIHIIKYLSTLLPLELFTFLGSILEEVIGPIPAPFVMVTAGSLARLNNNSQLFLLYIAITGAAGKLLVTMLWYLIGDKGEDFVVTKFGKFLGIDKEKIESWGKSFTGSTKDIGILFLLRAVPIFPTGIVSLVCGIIRIPFKSFTLISFIGIVVRNLIYLYIGYIGLDASKSLAHEFGGAEKLLKIGLTLAFIIVIAYIIYARTKRPSPTTPQN